MAQLKDLIVNGASQLIGDVYTSQIQISKLNSLTAANSTTYGSGSAGQVLTSNGTDTYWGIELNKYYGSFATNGWKNLGGRTSGPRLTISYNNDQTTWDAGIYSSSLLFGCNDTKGLLSIAYRDPIVSFAGGSADGTTNNDPRWYYKLSGTSGCTYTLPTDTKTLAANDGSNVTGTWTLNLKTNNIQAPTVAGGSTYGVGLSGQALLSNGTTIYWGDINTTVTESTVSGWGFTKNTGTITGATANGGLTVTGSTLGHSNTAITAKTTAGVYPVKIDELGHITEAGTAIVSSDATDGGTTLSLVTTGEKNIWNNKSSVSITPSLTSGTKIGTISIDGTDTDLYCQTNTDTKTRQTLYSSNYNLPLLMSYQTITNTTTYVDNITYRNNSIYANPSTGTITTPNETITNKLIINTLVGNSATYGDTLPATGVEGQIFFKKLS